MRLLTVCFLRYWRGSGEYDGTGKFRGCGKKDEWVFPECPPYIFNKITKCHAGARMLRWSSTAFLEEETEAREKAWHGPMCRGWGHRLLTPHPTVHIP